MRSKYRAPCPRCSAVQTAGVNADKSRGQASGSGSGQFSVFCPVAKPTCAPRAVDVGRSEADATGTTRGTAVPTTASPHAQSLSVLRREMRAPRVTPDDFAIGRRTSFSVVRFLAAAALAVSCALRRRGIGRPDVRGSAARLSAASYNLTFRLRRSHGDGERDTT